MLFKAFIALSSLTSAILATPLNPGPGPYPNTLSSRGHCLCQKDADTLTAAYLRMIGGWNDADAKYLADTGFTDTSDSINILAGVPLGSVIFPTKQAFIDHQHVAVRFNHFYPRIPVLWRYFMLCVRLSGY